MNRQKVERLAKKHGAILSRPYWWGDKHKEVTCKAPKGFWFCSDQCTEMVSPYYIDFGETVEDAYKDIYERLEHGIEPIPEESKYLYE